MGRSPVARARMPFGDLIRHRTGQDVLRHELLGLGHGELERSLVFVAAFVDLERGGQVEDGLAVLDGDHPPGGERLAIPDPIDLVHHRPRRIALAQEVPVQGVHVPVLRYRLSGGR